jgi:hypothetical protein
MALVKHHLEQRLSQLKAPGLEQRGTVHYPFVRRRGKRGGVYYWPDDDCNTPLDELRHDRAELIEVRLPDPLYCYDGNKAHETQSFTGADCNSFISFAMRGAGKLPVEDLSTLKTLGFNPPTSSAQAQHFKDDFDSLSKDERCVHRSTRIKYTLALAVETSNGANRAVEEKANHQEHLFFLPGGNNRRCVQSKSPKSCV